MRDLASLAESLAFIEQQYVRYQDDPESVPESWRRLFESARDGSNGFAGELAPVSATSADLLHYAQVFLMVNEYRKVGHLAADLDPLHAYPMPRPHSLDLAAYGFTDADLDREVPNGDFRGVAPTLTLGELYEKLNATYCGTVGVEYHHIAEPVPRNWLKERIETSLNRRQLDADTRRWILRRLLVAEIFEDFLHRKYVGTKRFSIQGAETLIPLLDLLLERAGEQDIREVVMGMAHRGRLSVLHNILDKKAEDIFSEFDDVDPQSVMGGGDVKYHLGASCDTMTRLGHEIHLSLSSNPSHLEAVDPTVLGRVRAKQRRFRDFALRRAFALLIHGDAAFAGQGLVAETLNLSNLWGYRTGGSIHVIVNNQIGFTATPTSQRSSLYASDVAKMLEVPIFHVNGEDPDAVAHVAAMAFDYRNEFNTDVVIDMLCFRRFGHNEADDPAFTQPLLYKKIDGRSSAGAVYAERLVKEGVIEEKDLDEMREEQRAQLQTAWDNAEARAERPQIHAFGGVWKDYQGGPEPHQQPDTGVPRERLEHIAKGLTTVPEGFHVHRTVQRGLDNRAEMGRGEQPLDWAMAELMAFGSLALEGTLVRMSGQDSRRGTFSQRHSVIVDQENGAEYMPLQYLDPEQAEVLIYDSLLSEAGCLGFEYGFSLDYPDALVLWEAQFGDFANGAQVIIDQFVATSEDKWRRISGLVMLLPHGYEGQGPEHSSARMERFLQLCAEQNMQVCYPTTPAQHFHLLRRQVLRPWRKPLIVLTPKSLLRHPRCKSGLEELESGQFQRVLDDPADLVAGDVDCIVLCTGKIYYDLIAAREERELANISFVRVEQLYPLWTDRLKQAVDRYANATDLVWVQEEPGNMGALPFIESTVKSIKGDRRVHFVARAPSASPATGSHKAHEIEQKSIIEQVFTYVGS